MRRRRSWGLDVGAPRGHDGSASETTAQQEEPDRDGGEHERHARAAAVRESAAPVASTKAKSPGRSGPDRIPSRQAIRARDAAGLCSWTRPIRRGAIVDRRKAACASPRRLGVYKRGMPRASSSSSSAPAFASSLAPALAALLAIGLAPAGLRAEGEAPPDAVPPDAVVGVVPFHDESPYRIRVDLAPEGNRPLVWMLDTGAQPNIMTPLAARERGVSVRRTKSSPYVRKTRLGRSVHFWVDTRSSDSGSRTGFEYALLGGEFLEEFVVEIDFPRRVVRFLDPDRYEVPEQASAPDERVVPMRVSAKRPFVEIEVDGRSTWALLDTGAPDDLVLSGRTAKKLGIDWKDLPNFGEYGSTAGPVDVRIHESEGVRLAGFEFAAMPVVVAPKGWFNMAGNTDSIIGTDVLRSFVVRLDYRRRRLWLKRSGTSEVTYLGVPYAATRRAGVFLRPLPDGRYAVVGLVPESPAARLGVRPGDILLRAGDEPAPAEEAEAPPLDLEAALARIERGEPFVVARPSGRRDWDEVRLPPEP